MCRLVYSLILKGSFHLMFDYIPEEKKTNKQTNKQTNETITIPFSSGAKISGSTQVRKLASNQSLEHKQTN